MVGDGRPSVPASVAAGLDGDEPDRDELGCGELDDELDDELLDRVTATTTATSPTSTAPRTASLVPEMGRAAGGGVAG